MDWVADLVAVRTAREILKGIGFGCRFSSIVDSSGDIKRLVIQSPRHIGLHSPREMFPGFSHTLNKVRSGDKNGLLVQSVKNTDSEGDLLMNQSLRITDYSGDNITS